MKDSDYEKMLERMSHKWKETFVINDRYDRMKGVCYTRKCDGVRRVVLKLLNDHLWCCALFFPNIEEARVGCWTHIESIGNNEELSSYKQDWALQDKYMAAAACESNHFNGLIDLSISQTTHSTFEINKQNLAHFIKEFKRSHSALRAYKKGTDNGVYEVMLELATGMLRSVVMGVHFSWHMNFFTPEQQDDGKIGEYDIKAMVDEDGLQHVFDIRIFFPPFIFLPDKVTIDSRKLWFTNKYSALLIIPGTYMCSTNEQGYTL